MAKHKQTSLTHTVFFNFKSKIGSHDQKSFREAAMKLENIPGVQNLKYVKQISKKNNYEYGLTMEFENDNIFEAYLKHEKHTHFVEVFWMNYVKDFLEIDYHE